MRSRLLLTGLAIAAMWHGVVAAAKPALHLIPVVASHDMIWNAVATERGRIFVAGPRWTGSQGPAVALIDRKGYPQPYPDEAWNGWTNGADPSHAFVSVNALHRDDRGGLWAIDTGTIAFGGDPLPGAAKAVRIALAGDKVERIYPLGPQAALAGSYIDDIRFHADHAYLTDAGRPGLLVLDLKTGAVRRVLDGAPAATAPPDRNIVVAGKVLNGPNGSPLRVNSDPLEVSPDGAFLYFAPLEGPWSKIETRWLDDPSIAPDVLASKVEPWADLPPTGGTAMDKNGNLYFSDLATDSIKRRAADGAIVTLFQDDRLHWVDAPYIDFNRSIWLPVPQLDRVALFNGGKSRIQWPVQLFRLEGAALTASGHSL
jgi:sugar lactone lactonase YvrE